MIHSQTHRLLINGEEVEAHDGDTLSTSDPSTGEVIAQVARAKEVDIDLAVSAARNAFEMQWFDTAPLERGRLLSRIAAAIRENSESLALLSARNAGLPLQMARSDVEVAARYFEFYSGLPDKLGGEVVPLGPAFLDYTLREPWGVCGIITPFNLPFQLASRSIAPALAAGNTLVIKAAEQDPLPLLALGRLMQDCALPRGVVNIVPGLGHDAGAHLAAHLDVDHVTFTGSLLTGQRVMELAATQLTPTTIELGGKSPQIIFADANVDEAVSAIVRSAFLTAGQACSAGTRILVESSLAHQVSEGLAEIARNIVVGPALEGPQMGPLISKRQQEGTLQAVARGVASGARLLAGGALPHDEHLQEGFFVLPTVFDHVDPNAELARNEIFGPVLAIMEFHENSAALHLANDSAFGLVAGIWTRDIGRAHHLARKLRAGQVFINNYGTGGGVELPFGGYKKSGIGREKGIAGFYEYTQLKNVCVKVDLS